MADLDDLGDFARLDPCGMLTSIAELPQQCEEAWRQSLSIELWDEHVDVDSVLIVGVGGSAIGGDMVRTLLASDCPVPVAVHRDYALPGYVGPRTLLIVCSYSGNTEEALSGWANALRLGARLLAVTTGGELKRKAVRAGVPVCVYQYPTQPRAAVGYSFMYLLRIVQDLGLVRDKSEDVEEAISVMRGWQAEIGASVPLVRNAAKSLAQRLHGRLPVVYSAEHLGDLSRRWKGQINENSKSWATFDVLPELDHNSVVGYGLPECLAQLAHVVMLVSTLYHSQVLLRFDITRQLLERNGYAHDTVEARGESVLAQMLSLLHFGDYVSYYLAMLNEVDPWAIGNIEFVKDRLNASRQLVRP